MMPTPTTAETDVIPSALDAPWPSEGGPSAFEADLVVADASWIWTERLFSPLAGLGHRVLLLKACDWRNALQQRRPTRDWLFPCVQRADNLWEQTCILPPGWMKTYPQLGMRPIASAIRHWRRSLSAQNQKPKPLALAISYPHYLFLSDLLRPDHLIYYNMDDYRFYWTARAGAIRRLARRAVLQDDLSVFCSKVRTEEWRSAEPSASDRIIHLPHGAPASSIAPEPCHRPAPAPIDIEALPRPLLGFIGSLGDRIDWPLLDRLALALPQASIVLIGRPPKPAPRAQWYQDYCRVVDRPNVHGLGWRPQRAIGQYNATFDVCLIPYQVDHPFNRASCPTKIMDYMATSRPVVSTSIPECRLYSHLFEVAESPESFIEAVRSIIARGSDDGRATDRWQLARQRTWEHTAETLLDQLRDRIRDQ